MLHECLATPIRDEFIKATQLISLPIKAQEFNGTIDHISYLCRLSITRFTKLEKATQKRFSSLDVGKQGSHGCASPCRRQTCLQLTRIDSELRSCSEPEEAYMLLE